MSNQHGGYRRPLNPAPASGPGRLSKRTDGGPGQKLQAPTGMPYGDHQALLAQERTAPMSQSNSIPPSAVPAAPAGPGGTPPQLTPLDAPSARPGEPITHGVDIGPGAGSEALPAAPAVQPTGYLTGLLGQLSASDMTGALADLYLMAKQRGV